MKKPKIDIDEFNREQADKIGYQSWALRHVVTCPYVLGSQLAKIWEAGRQRARRERERPPVEEKVETVESLTKRLDRHLGGKR